MGQSWPTGFLLWHKNIIHSFIHSFIHSLFSDWIRTPSPLRDSLVHPTLCGDVITCSYAEDKKLQSKMAVIAQLSSQLWQSKLLFHLEILWFSETLHHAKASSFRWRWSLLAVVNENYHKPGLESGPGLLLVLGLGFGLGQSCFA